MIEGAHQLKKVITTSWDDGHVADFRLAELLEKYTLKGTFYIPASNEEHPVMTEQQVVELSKTFEIGGHTMTHRTMNTSSEGLFEAEIKGCHEWLANLLGETPVSFCFPRGAYTQDALSYAFATGFRIIRTTELLNPWLDEYNPVIPTTLQVYRHSQFTYIKHLCKRFNVKSLLLYLKSSRSAGLQKNVEVYLDYIQQNGGCFHLWGHSWEIEEYNLWKELEYLFKIMSDIPGIQYTDNKGLLQFKQDKQVY